MKLFRGFLGDYKFILLVFLSLLFFIACSSKNNQSSSYSHTCSVKQPFPYFNSPYPGIHGNSLNNERINCSIPESAPVQGWTALKGMMIFNPITVGKEYLYVPVIRFKGCKLWKVSLKDGSASCFYRGDPELLSVGVVGSSPEIDNDGNIYVADGWMKKPDGVYSFDENGNLRWHISFKGLRKREPALYTPPLGVHFDSEGDVVTVSPDGLVVVMSRGVTDGTAKIKGYFEITRETVMKPLKKNSSVAGGQIPSYLECRMRKVFGEVVSAETLKMVLSGGTGESGAYTDNTLAVSGDEVFVVGGGPDAGDGQSDNGALLALKLDYAGGKVKIKLHWYMILNGATGSSPSLSPDGKWVVVSDATNEGHARIVVANVDKCDSLKDGSECRAGWKYELLGSPLLAHLSIDEDGVVYAWNQGTGSNVPDLLAVAPPDSEHKTPWVKWSINFPSPDPELYPKSDWSSTVLILNNIVVGTVAYGDYVSVGGSLPLPIPVKLYSELVGVSRSDGRLLWHIPIADSSINSPLLGPDGNLYVPIYGMLDFVQLPEGDSSSCLSTFTGGVVQFKVK